MIRPLVREHLRHHAQQSVLNAIVITLVVTMLLTIVATSSTGNEHSRFEVAAKGMLHAMAWTGAAAAMLVLFVNRISQVKDRTREFAILRVLGGSFSYMAVLLLQETLCLALPGAVAGLVLAQLNDSLIALLLRGLVSVNDPYLFWLPSGLVAATCFFTASLVGARSGMRLDVLEALGHEG